MDTKKQIEAEFLQLIIGLESSGWVTLGKIANPMTGKLEKNLQAAKGIIDTLTMLKEKTKGNLSKNEENILNSVLQNLQLNYVEEAGKPEEKKEEEHPKESEEKKPEETQLSDKKADKK